MDTVKLRTDIEHATECLYQNRGQDGLEAVRNLLPAVSGNDTGNLCRGRQCACAGISGSVKTLIENYQAQDMLGMADCLKGSAEEMILCLEAEENRVRRNKGSEQMTLLDKNEKAWKQRNKALLEQLYSITIG